MGSLRTIFALAVVLSHCNGLILNLPSGLFSYVITGGDVAVQCFYIISGYYMALILNDKYTQGKKGLLLFYSNRFYRLMPLYYFFLIISFCLSFLSFTFHQFPQQLTTGFFINFKLLKPATFVTLVFICLFILGHDLSCLFMGISKETGSLFFSTDVVKEGTIQGVFNFLPQSWTLSLEFYFYLMVPFLVKRLNLTIILIVMSLFLRMYLYASGFNDGVWTYVFFPNELALFLLGTISYRIYNFLEERKLINKINSFIISGIIFILVFGYQFYVRGKSIPHFFYDSQLILYSSLILGLPFLFHISKNLKFDRIIGELSYPMYLSHLMILPFFSNLYALHPSKSFHVFNVYISLYIITTILVSYLSVIFIQRPVDEFRQNRFLRMSSGE